MEGDCEWLLLEGEHLWGQYATGCMQHFPHMKYEEDNPTSWGFLYCPFCGRELVEVEREEE